MSGDTREAAIEKLAQVLHESGRQAVAERKVYRSDLPVKPFAEWADLDENTKEGRRLMAQYLVANFDEVQKLIHRLTCPACQYED